MKTSSYTLPLSRLVLAGFIALTMVSCQYSGEHTVGSVHLARLIPGALSVSAKVEDQPQIIPSVHPNQETYTVPVNPVSAND